MEQLGLSWEKKPKKLTNFYNSKVVFFTIDKLMVHWDQTHMFFSTFLSSL